MAKLALDRRLSGTRSATMVLEIEERVAAIVKKLKERGSVSPYLRSLLLRASAVAMD
jgi:hypothetical protein